MMTKILSIKLYEIVMKVDVEVDAVGLMRVVY